MPDPLSRVPRSDRAGMRRVLRYANRFQPRPLKYKQMTDQRLIRHREYLKRNNLDTSGVDVELEERHLDQASRRSLIEGREAMTQKRQWETETKWPAEMQLKKGRVGQGQQRINLAKEREGRQGKEGQAKIRQGDESLGLRRQQVELAKYRFLDELRQVPEKQRQTWMGFQYRGLNYQMDGYKQQISQHQTQLRFMQAKLEGETDPAQADFLDAQIADQQSQVDQLRKKQHAVMGQIQALNEAVAKQSEQSGQSWPGMGQAGLSPMGFQQSGPLGAQPLVPTTQPAGGAPLAPSSQPAPMTQPAGAGQPRPTPEQIARVDWLANCPDPQMAARARARRETIRQEWGM